MYIVHIYTHTYIYTSWYILQAIGRDHAPDFPMEWRRCVYSSGSNSNHKPSSCFLFSLNLSRLFFFFLAAGRFSLCLFYFILFFYMFHSTSAKCTIYSIPVIITTFFIIIIIRWPLYLTLILHQTRQCLCIYCHFTNK